MSKDKVDITVRTPTDLVGILDIEGELTASAEGSLMAAHQQASDNGARTIALNFARLKSIDSSGIGLLIVLLATIRRQRQRPVAYGLADAQRQIFELTQLHEALEFCADDTELLRSVRP